MIKKWILYLSIFCTALLSAEEPFTICYGQSEAPLKVTEYLSFSCPHCIKLFKDFPKIKKDFIDSGKIFLTIQPLPKDLTTLRSLHCFERMDNKEKQIFLEGLFEYLEQNDDDADALCRVMQDFMTCFGKEKLPLDDLDYLKNSPLMQVSFQLLKQKQEIKALPTAEINGFLFMNDIPNYAFFAEAVEAVLGEKE